MVVAGQPAMHFISGLPRAGSTLLAAILRQNPAFHAAMSSPLAAMLVAMQAKMSNGEFNTFYDDATRVAMLRGAFDSYYSIKAPMLDSGSVIFDSNRSWTARPALLAKLYPNSRIICCVRHVGWIADSIENMLIKNPLQFSRIFNYQPGNSINARVEQLMNSETGLIGLPWNHLRDAWFGPFANRLILIQYDRLASQPQQTMQALYRALDLPPFQHDFQNVSYAADDYDDSIGMPGLHKIDPVVCKRERQPILPPEIYAKAASTHFWEGRNSHGNSATLL